MNKCKILSTLLSMFSPIQYANMLTVSIVLVRLYIHYFFFQRGKEKPPLECVPSRPLDDEFPGYGSSSRLTMTNTCSSFLFPPHDFNLEPTDLNSL